MAFTPTYDWPLRFKQTRSWVIILVVLGCYFFFTKENIFTSFAKALGKDDPKERRLSSRMLGGVCFWTALDKVLQLMADYCEMPWLKYGLLILFLALLAAVGIRAAYRAYRKRHKLK